MSRTFILKIIFILIIFFSLFKIAGIVFGVTAKAQITATIIKKEKPKIIIHPIPFKRRKHHKIIFSGLSNPTTIKIYNIAGELVRTIYTIEERFEWKVDNDFGNKLASGIYFAQVIHKNYNKIFKLAIIK